MIGHLLLGTVVIAISVAMQAEMYNLYSGRFNRLVFVLRRHLHRFSDTGVIIVSVLYIMLVLTMVIWLWTTVYVIVGAFEEVEPALYFTMITFTTVGYGDVVLSQDWRVLAGVTASNGFISFGWSTAYMVELLRKAR